MDRKREVEKNMLTSIELLLSVNVPAGYIQVLSEKHKKNGRVRSVWASMSSNAWLSQIIYRKCASLSEFSRFRGKCLEMIGRANTSFETQSQKKKQK
jgi:hypothetical protein